MQTKIYLLAILKNDSNDTNSWFNSKQKKKAKYEPHVISLSILMECTLTYNFTKCWREPAVKSHAEVIMTRPEVMLLLMKIWGWSVQMYEKMQFHLTVFLSAEPLHNQNSWLKLVQDENICSWLDILIRLQFPSTAWRFSMKKSISNHPKTTYILQSLIIKNSDV